jgi:hypothetical protein
MDGARNVFLFWPGARFGRRGQRRSFQHRSAAGTTRGPASAWLTGHFIAIVVDGRQPDYSVGMLLDEFAQLFVDHGCRLPITSTAAFRLHGLYGRAAQPSREQARRYIPGFLSAPRTGRACLGFIRIRFRTWTTQFITRAQARTPLRNPCVLAFLLRQSFKRPTRTPVSLPLRKWIASVEASVI